MVTERADSSNLGNPDQNFQQCIQESGDLVYIPDGWGHAVENLAESVGYALEFDWAAKNVNAADAKKGKKGGRAGTPQPGKGQGAEPPGGAGAGPTDWTTPRLMKQRTKHLRAILKEDFHDGCKGCKQKHEFVQRLQSHLRNGDDKNGKGSGGGGGGGTAGDDRSYTGARQRATDEL